LASDLDTTRCSGWTGGQEGNGFFEFLAAVLICRWLVVKLVGVAVLVGLILCLLLPVLYTSTVKIVPPTQNEQGVSLLLGQFAGMGSGALGAGSASALSLLRNPNGLYVGLLGSRPVADGLIREFNLTQVYHCNGLEQARKVLASKTKISTDTKSSLISVSITDKDKVLAARIANGYITELRNLTQSLAVTEASQRAVFYEGQLKRDKDSLVAAEFAFQQIQQKEGLFKPDTQAMVMINGLASTRAQIAAEEVRLQDLLQFSTENNPSVQQAENHLRSLKEQLYKQEQGGDISTGSGPGLAAVPGATLEYLKAQHDLQYQTTLFDLLVKQYDAARLDEAKEAVTIQVVEPAIVPEHKSSPHRLRILVSAVFMGFFGACALVYLREKLRRSRGFSQGLAQLRGVLRTGSGNRDKVSIT
jgi:tyrosine-protein kinase Etk/Wzc